MPSVHNNWYRCKLCGWLGRNRIGMVKHLARTHGWTEDSPSALFYYTRVRPTADLVNEYVRQRRESYEDQVARIDNLVREIPT